jgi:hypothetical protein
MVMWRRRKMMRDIAIGSMMTFLFATGCVMEQQEDSAVENNGY